VKPNNPFHTLSLLSTFTIPLIFIVFWLHHARIFAGDGRLIARLIEDGKWFVTNELFSQAILQTLFTALRHWSITPLEIMNLCSTVCGTVALVLLARFGHRYQVSFSWSLILFLSSGFFIYACGHTEYYPMLLPVLFWYGHASCDYLANAGSYKKAGFVFLLGCSLHLAMLIALPSLLLLPIGYSVFIPHPYHPAGMDCRSSPVMRPGCIIPFSPGTT